MTCSFSSFIASVNTLRRVFLRATQVAIVSAGLTALPAFADSTDRVSVPKINWQACGADFPRLECAIVKVPLDYDQPNGPQTTIAVSRFPATDKKNRIGSIFVNPGGPGGSGVDLVLFGFGELLSEKLRGRFDVVGWDPRGIGGSTPIQCWANNAAAGAYFDGVPGFPYRTEQEAPFFERYRNVANVCFGRNQLIIRHMSTADVVRDLDVLRQAVGDQRLTYLGYSYGTYIGNTYANMFPNKVRALVIDGVLDPILWSSGWQIKSDRVASYEVLEQFFKQCDLATTNCSLNGQGGAKKKFESLMKTTRKAPLILVDETGPFEFGYDNLIGQSAGVMYSPEIWPLYADFLQLVFEGASGNNTAAASAGKQLRALEKMLRDAKPSSRAEGDAEPYDNGTEAYYGNQCSDTEYPSASLPVYSAIGKYAEAGSPHGPYWWWGNAACASWPVAKDRYIGPWTARTSSPVLVIGNFFDPATDYAGAVSSDQLLQNSRLLSYAGWGHTVSYSDRSTCVDNYVTSYLIDGTLPPRGTVCPAAQNPFTPVASSASRIAAPALPKTGLPTLKPAGPTRGGASK